MPAALIRIGSAILNAWRKTKTARQVFSLTKNTLKSRWDEQTQADPFFPVFIMIVVCFCAIVLLVAFPGLLPGILSATAIVAL